MRPSIITLAALAAGVSAFKDTSPFVLFSTSPFHTGLEKSAPLRTNDEVITAASTALSLCNTEVYLFVNAPGITSSDLSSHAPHLRRAASDRKLYGRYIVTEALGLTASTADNLAEVVRKECRASTADESSTMAQALTQTQGGKPIIVSWNYESSTAAGESRDAMVANTDAHFYNNFMRDLEGLKYTVVFSTTPSDTLAADEITYEPTFDVGVHMDLKRALLTRAPAPTASNDTRPLFEKYQYFTPGLFMGILVSLLLLSILSVGISAISSLEVSYGAFEKEMGPAAQKKAQ